MKNKFLWLFLSLFLVFSFAGSGWSDQNNELGTIMHPDQETLHKWIQELESAPKVQIDPKLSIPLKDSLSLLSHLNYVAADRNQGSCGNCWAWAGTGVMEIALDVEEGIFGRLSLQYLNSCKTGSYACCGGNLTGFIDYYTSTGQAIPWSNTNAQLQDAGRECADGSSLVSCGSIATSPITSEGN